MKKKTKATKALSFKGLVLVLTQLEAGKEQVNVAQMTEVLARLRQVFRVVPADVIRVLAK